MTESVQGAIADVMAYGDETTSGSPATAGRARLAAALAAAAAATVLLL